QVDENVLQRRPAEGYRFDLAAEFVDQPGHPLMSARPLDPERAVEQARAHLEPLGDLLRERLGRRRANYHHVAADPLLELARWRDSHQPALVEDTHTNADRRLVQSMPL